MRKKKFIISFVPYFIGIILFCIPFFWLKPGEMDLGGDSSRLFFYDPISYLFNQSLYGLVPTGIGGEAISYFAIPYMLLLIVIKTILQSPTLLIAFFNGLTLSVAFISVYLIIKELEARDNTENKFIVEFSAIAAGILYIFSPYLIAGWDRALLTHYQVFLNPLMFFLLMRFLLTSASRYLAGALLITVIFSPNFAYVAAPPVFSFYPLSFLFLFIYTKYIRKISIPIKGLFIGLVIFIVIQSFHIVPHILTITTSGSQISNDVFSEWSRLSKGQDYFAAIAPSVKVSISWMNLLQGTKGDILSIGFIIFPLIIFSAFLFEKKKLLFITGIFFLITLFFSTANITGLGFNFYKSLFYIPGFSMFRNFYGQWGFVFVFFYALLIGQSLNVVLRKLDKRLKYILIVFFVAFLTFNAWPFINGSLIKIDLFQTDHIKPVIEMDPKYKEVLSYVRALPVDGKILSFPFNDPGYQIIAGENGGAYVGPSTFSYLAGKNDFTGYDGLMPFSGMFLNMVLNGDTESLSKLFSILNIRYIFHNSDSQIYNNSFTGFPYNFVFDFLPKDQNTYKEFVKQLPINLIKNFGENYHLYITKDTFYLPHIFTTLNVIYTNKPFTFFSVSGFDYPIRSAVLNIDSSKNNTDTIILEAENNNPLLELKDNYHLHRHEPFTAIRPNNFLYPFSILKEIYSLDKVKKDKNKYLDLSLYTASKRIHELDKWKETIMISEKKWKEPKIWEFYKWKNNNTWEGILGRYKTQMEQVITWITSSDDSNKIEGTNKIKINEQLFYHKTLVLETVKEANLKVNERRYLLMLTDQIFTTLFKKLKLEDYKAFDTQYVLQVPKNGLGEYEVYLEKMDENNNLLSQAQIRIGDQILKPIDDNSHSELLRFNNIVLQSSGNKELSLYLHLKNFINDLTWDNSGDAKNIKDTTELYIKNISLNNFGGLNKEIVGWKPNTQYLISFEYNTFGDNLKFILYDKKYNKLEKKIVKGRTFFEKRISSSDWEVHQSVISSSNDSVEAYIKVLGDLDKSTSKFQIRNLSVLEVTYPRIYFKKITPEITKKPVSPQITFAKVNQSKYIINVSNAKDPYTLVFLEAFNKNWNLVNPDYTASSFKSKATRLLALIAENITNMFIKNKQRGGSVTASYYNGDVNEGRHTSIFLEPNTFETWGKESVASNKHIPIYGYANAWQIDLEDTHGKTDYTLVLELGTQKKFYVLICISALAIIGLFVFFISKLFKKNEKNH